MEKLGRLLTAMVAPFNIGPKSLAFITKQG